MTSDGSADKFAPVVMLVLSIHRKDVGETTTHFVPEVHCRMIPGLSLLSIMGSLG